MFGAAGVRAEKHEGGVSAATTRARGRPRRFAWISVLGLAVVGAALPTLSGCFGPQTRLQKEEDLPDKDTDVKTIGDVTEVANANPTLVSGIGLVVGLDGTGCPTSKGTYRTLLEKELQQQKVEHIPELLNSDNCALVLVSALIPAGAHKHDPLDVDVMLPPGNQSKATSLRGGYLLGCFLKNFDTTKNLNPKFEGSDRFLEGHRLAVAKGALIVGFGDGDEAAKVRRGRVWSGGLSLIDRPFFLTLNNDQQFARIANAIADRINQKFQDDGRKRPSSMNRRLLVLNQVTDGIGERFRAQGDPTGANTARAMSREVVYVRVPWEYHLNPARYLRVARLIPLQETPEIHNHYRRRLERRLLIPAKTMSAALRLEALGNESISALKEGLKSENVLVRFCSAEALAYLGSPAGGPELARLLETQEKLRAYCLIALASLNESVCHTRLTELLNSASAETRFGAFRALYMMDERDPDLHGEQLNESFWLHRVAPDSKPLVTVSGSRRAELVLFGEEPAFVPPVRIVAGEFTVTASGTDDRCTVGRFPMNGGRVERRQCTLKLADVLRALADLGAAYPDVTGVLAQAGRDSCLSCPVRVDPMPELLPVEKLAENANNPEFWATAPAEKVAVKAEPAEPEFPPAATRETR
jgi:hypothetical protein